MKKKSGRNEDRPRATPEDRRKYEDAWSKMMIDIWREKIDRFRVVDTRTLRQQMTERVTENGSAMTTIQHRFMMYGIYQDCGVGRGYEHNNGGNLEFLKEEYRIEHEMGEPRKPREWFSRAYFASVMVLKEQEAYMYGEEFCGLIAEAIESSFHRRSTSMRSNLWGHHGRTV